MKRRNAAPAATRAAPIFFWSKSPLPGEPPPLPPPEDEDPKPMEKPGNGFLSLEDEEDCFEEEDEGEGADLAGGGVSLDSLLFFSDDEEEDDLSFDLGWKNFSKPFGGCPLKRADDHVLYQKVT